MVEPDMVMIPLRVVFVAVVAAVASIAANVPVQSGSISDGRRGAINLSAAVRESTDGACSDDRGSIDWGREPLFDGDRRISKDGHEEIVAEHFDEQAALWLKGTLFFFLFPFVLLWIAALRKLHEMKSFLRSTNELGEEYDDIEAEHSNSPLIYHVMAVVMAIGLSFFVAFFCNNVDFQEGGSLWQQHYVKVQAVVSLCIPVIMWIILRNEFKELTYLTTEGLHDAVYNYYTFGEHARHW